MFLVLILDLPDQGEVCIKGASVFKGYFKDPMKTREAIDSENWLHTGDIGQWQNVSNELVQ